VPNALVHPKLMQHMAQHHFPNVVSIQVHTITYDPANEPIETWLTNPLLIDLAAYIEPVDEKIEIRRSDQTIIINGWIISLSEYYPTIEEVDQVTDELGKIYNILGVDFDAFHTQTNLTVEIINA
jgi:hypothetical protein